MVLGKEVCELLKKIRNIRFSQSHEMEKIKIDSYSCLVGRLGEDGLLPEIRSEIAVGLGDGGVGGLG